MITRDTQINNRLNLKLHLKERDLNAKEDVGKSNCVFTDRKVNLPLFGHHSIPETDPPANIVVIDEPIMYSTMTK